MTWDDFDAWAPRSVRDLAAGRVAAGLQETADADAFAEGLLLDLLPDGLATPLHHLWSVRCGPSDETVGHLWMRVRPLEREVEAYVLDVGIEPAARGRGLGRATMLAAERAARDLAATVVRLTVLAANTAARRLYDSLGYTVAAHDITLAKYVIFVMTIIAAAAAGQFVRLRKPAGLLLLPYLVWLIFAATLNATIETLNPGAGTPLFS